MFIKKNHVAGFTLMETLIYIAVLTIITAVLIAFMIWAIRSNAKIKVGRITLDETRRAMEIMLYEIKESQSVYTPTSIFDSNPGQVSLETAHNLPSDEKTTYLDFYVCGNQLCVKRENAAATAITSNRTIVNNLVFSRVLASTTETIQINLNLKYNTPSSRIEWQASTTLISTATLKGY